MIQLIRQLVAIITFSEYRARRRALKLRSNYEFIRKKIVERHLAGHAGLVVDFKERKIDRRDLQSFRRPMYQIAMTQDRKFCIFWDKKKMTEEIGPAQIH